MSKRNVENTIIQLLGNGSLEKQILIDRVVKQSHVTIQAVYKNLRKLTVRDSITIHKKSVSLTLLHIERELQYWETVSGVYHTRPLASHFLGLREGDSLSLRFKNLNELDTYWVHAFLLLERQLPKNFPTYSVIPHDWFYYGRRETDVFWTQKQKRKQRLIVTHPDKIDMLALRERRKQGYEMTPSVNPLHQEEHEYFTVVSDWVFKVTIDKKLHADLLRITQQARALENIDQVSLQKLLSKRGQNTMKIYKSKKRADVIIKKVQKYFE
ncbi:MAG: hypothetical protein AAB388_04145 [Patescibacteria group bacterium]